MNATETMTLEEHREASKANDAERISVGIDVQQALRDLLTCAEAGRVATAEMIASGRALIARADACLDESMRLCMGVRIA